MYGENRSRGNFRGGSGNRGNFGGGNRGGPAVAPVKVDEMVDVKIEAVGEKGDGIAKKNGFVIFVPNGKQGQSVKVKITRVLKKMAFSEIVGEASEVSNDESSDSEKQAPKEEENFDSGSDSEDFGEEEQSSDDEEWK